jgi:hypothetical protein
LNPSLPLKLASEEVDGENTVDQEDRAGSIQASGVQSAPGWKEFCCPITATPCFFKFSNSIIIFKRGAFQIGSSF